jgi:hypothetical protein
MKRVDARDICYDGLEVGEVVEVDYGPFIVNGVVYDTPVAYRDGLRREKVISVRGVYEWLKVDGEVMRAGQACSFTDGQLLALDDDGRHVVVSDSDEKRNTVMIFLNGRGE